MLRHLTIQWDFIIILKPTGCGEVWYRAWFGSMRPRVRIPTLRPYRVFIRDFTYEHSIFFEINILLMYEQALCLLFYFMRTLWGCTPPQRLFGYLPCSLSGNSCQAVQCSPRSGNKSRSAGYASCQHLTNASICCIISGSFSGSRSQSRISAVIGVVQVNASFSEMSSFQKAIRRFRKSLPQIPFQTVF